MDDTDAQKIFKTDFSCDCLSCSTVEVQKTSIKQTRHLG